MKKNTLLTLAMLSLVAFLQAQPDRFGPCGENVRWESITMTDAPPPPGKADFLIITNRPFMREDPDGILFPNEISEFRKVTYLLASCREGSWQLSPVAGFQEGMAHVDQGEDILLFVHGHGKSMPAVLARSSQIRQKYGSTLLVFDWPSFNMNFNKSLSRVRRCGENYYNLLLQLQEYRENLKPDQRLSMLLHSLGNYFLTHLVVNGNNQYMDEVIFDNIVLNSPAVRSKEHGGVISQIRFAKRLYVVYNHNDRVLRGAHLLTTGKMLGNEVIKPLATGTTYVDFTCVTGKEHTYFTGYHEFEFDLPVFAHFFDAAIGGRKVDFSDPSMFVQGEAPSMFIVKDHASDCPR